MVQVQVMDTGLRTGRENIAHDQAMIDAHVAGLIGDRFKFIHFKPCALVGRHQDLSQELKLEACARLGVQTVRRVTGGGAIYFDEGQLGWALVCDRRTVGGSLADITQKICTAAAKGLSGLGFDARFRPRNDIEVNGQKISGTGGFFDGNTLMFQGTVLIDLDPATMMQVLNVPAHKLKKRDLESAADRVTCLKAILGEAPTKEAVQTALLDGFRTHLGFEFETVQSNDTLEGLAKKAHDEEIGTDEFVYEINDLSKETDILTGTNAKGNLQAHLRLDGAQDNRIREVVFTGDVFVTPPRTLLDLEAHLRGKLVKSAPQEIDAFFKSAPIGMISLSPEEFADAVLEATT